MTDKKARHFRKQLWINREAQGAIIKRSIFHWYLCTSLILLVVVIFTALKDPSRSALPLIYELWNHYAPAILASFVLLPVFALDLLKGSNKIAGPLHRLRNEMIKLQNGEQIRPLHFRDGDFWPELAEQFNELASQIQREREAMSSEHSGADSTCANPVAG